MTGEVYWFILIMESAAAPQHTTANELSNKTKQAFNLVVILAEPLHNEVLSGLHVLPSLDQNLL